MKGCANDEDIVGRKPPGRFTVLWPDAGGLAMFAEYGQFLIDLPDARFLDPASASDPAALDPERLERLRSNLEELAARGLWSSGDGDGTLYAKPDFTAAPRPLGELGPDSQWLTLADPCEDSQIALVAAALALPPSISAVVVDDPLDPRLGTLDGRFRASRRPWLLLRLAGEHPTVGPLFNAADDAACWSCLSFRVLWNQPVRRWYHRTHRSALEPIPVAFRPQALARELPRFVMAARRLVTTRRSDTMTELPWAGSEAIAHPVIRRPQCSVCGAPSLYAARAGAPIVLGRANKAWQEDGGVRTREPAETAAALSRIISPVSGLVAGLVCRSPPEEYVSRVYRSWFSKTTYRAGLPRTEQLFQTALGKGISAAQSRVSALSESIERLASSYHGDEPVVCARAGELPGRSFLPSALARYSDTQYRAFAAGDPRKAALHAMLPAGAADVLHWTPVWSLTHAERCFVPFTWCYANTPYDDDLRCRFFHNGGAAGNCLEEAILQGFLELVERDAVAIWWYNRIPRPAVYLGALPDELDRQMAATVGRHSDYWVLDVTHDLGVPVFVAVSRRRDSGSLCLGFGCHLDAALALRRALTELCQILEIRTQHWAPFDFEAIIPEPHLFPDDTKASVPLSAYPAPATSDIADDVRACVSRAWGRGLEVLVLDYSRPDFPLSTAKVIIPGTCHIFPYRAAARLYSVPVDMGWRSTPLAEAELNQLELLI